MSMLQDPFGGALTRTRESGAKLFSWWWTLAGFMVLWPQDAPWTQDEPLLVTLALNANQQGIWAHQGLQGGAFGLIHGPLSVWIYQVLLALTPDLILLTAIKGTLFAICLPLSLALTARRAGLPRDPIPLALTAPFIWLAARKLWDNCWIVPMASFAFWLYIRFSEKPTMGKLAALAALALVMLHTHLMSLLLIMALMVSLVLTQWSFFANFPNRVLGLLLAALLLAAPYLSLAPGQIEQRIAHGPPGLGAGVKSLLAGVTLMGGWGPGIGFLPEMATDRFLRPVSNTFIVLGWATACHLVLACVGLLVFVRDWIAPGSAPDSNCAKPLAVLCVGCLLITALFFSVTATPLHAHYFSAVWPAYFWCIAKGIGVLYRRFERRRWPALLVRGHVIAMAGFLLAIMVFIHSEGGTRTPFYGATIGNQIQVARMTAHCTPPCQIHSQVLNDRLFPQGLNVLRHLARMDAPPCPSFQASGYEIHYRDQDPGAFSGWIDVTPMADGHGHVGGAAAETGWR